MDHIIIVFLFFLVALFYSAAGFGGGSSYLAILALFAIDFLNIRFIALCCNIVVVSSSVFLFHKSGLINWRKIFPIILFSIPMAFLGGLFKIEETFFFLLLGVTLLISAILMLIRPEQEIKELPSYRNGIMGGSIGLLSGLVGIGGGIFLSPVLHLTRWGKPKVIAATTATFILVNSMAGLGGQWLSGNVVINYRLLIPLVAAVFVGGQLGSRMTIHWLAPIIVKRVTAVLIFLVAMRILLINMLPI